MIKKICFKVILTMAIVFVLRSSLLGADAPCNTEKYCIEGYWNSSGKWICTKMEKPSGNYGCEIGKFMGVKAFSNGGRTGTPYGDLDYQCVGYVNFFYKKAFVQPIDLPKIGWAKNYYTCFDDNPEWDEKTRKDQETRKSALKQAGFERIPNNASGILIPGDIIVFEKEGEKWGHCSIYMYMKDGKAWFIEQNWPNKGGGAIRSLPVIITNGNHKIDDSDTLYKVLGWLHSSKVEFPPKVIKFPDSPKVYLVSNGQLWHIGSESDFIKLGYHLPGQCYIPDWSHVQEVDLTWNGYEQWSGKYAPGKLYMRSETLPSVSQPYYNPITYRVVGKIGPESCGASHKHPNRIYIYGEDKKFHWLDMTWDQYVSLGYDANGRDIVDITPELFFHYGEAEKITLGYVYGASMILGATSQAEESNLIPINDSSDANHDQTTSAQGAELGNTTSQPQDSTPPPVRGSYDYGPVAFKDDPNIPTSPVQGGPVAHYPFNRTFFDKSGNGNHLSNQDTSLSKHFNNSVYTRNFEFLSIGDSAQTGLDLKNGLTFEAKFALHRKIDHEGAIISKWDAKANERSYILEYRRFWDDYFITLVLYGLGADGKPVTDILRCPTEANFRPLKPHEIEVRWSGATRSALFTIDGKPAGTAYGKVCEINDSAAPFVVGAGSAGREHFLRGYIIEVAVWDYPLLFEEVEENSIPVQDVPIQSEEGLIARYTFENDSSYFDISGAGNHLEPANSPIIEGGAVNFRAADKQHLKILDVNQTGLNFGDSFTMAAWFKFHSTPSWESALFSKWFAPTNQRGFLLSYRLFQGDFYLTLLLSDNGNITDNHLNILRCTVPQNFNYNEWHHIAVSYDAGIVRFYVDGQKTGNDLISSLSNIYKTPMPFVIGAGAAGNADYLDAMADDIRIYSRALSPKEIFSIQASDSKKPKNPILELLTGLVIPENEVIATSPTTTLPTTTSTTTSTSTTTTEPTTTSTTSTTTTSSTTTTTSTTSTTSTTLAPVTKPATNFYSWRKKLKKNWHELRMMIRRIRGRR